MSIDAVFLIEESQKEIELLHGEVNRAKRRLRNPKAETDLEREALERFLEDEVVEICTEKPCLGDEIHARYCRWMTAQLQKKDSWDIALTLLKETIKTPKSLYKLLETCGFEKTTLGHPANKVKFNCITLK